MDGLIEWVTANQVTIAVGWAAVIAFAELLKRLIPGTKDDEIIVKVLDTVGKVATIGAASMLPNQDGRLKP